MLKRVVTAALIVPMLLLIASCGRTTSPKDSTASRSDQDAGNWLMYGRTYDDHRFSPLTQINEQTIGKLGLAWSHEFGTTRGLEATPLVEDGIIYTSGNWSVVYAIDAKTGKVRWTYDPKVTRSRAYFICCDVVNRGVALYHRQGLCGNARRKADRSRRAHRRSGVGRFDDRQRQTLCNHRSAPHRERQGDHRQCRRRIWGARIHLGL